TIPATITPTSHVVSSFLLILRHELQNIFAKPDELDSVARRERSTAATLYSDFIRIRLLVVVLRVRVLHYLRTPWRTHHEVHVITLAHRVELLRITGTQADSVISGTDKIVDPGQESFYRTQHCFSAPSILVIRPDASTVIQLVHSIQ